jgi:ubiquinone/menaquinone biosynthesis C-methylase UbiE
MARKSPLKLLALREFFNGRSADISPTPTLQELCYVSGADPRLWTQEPLYRDMMESIQEQLEVRKDQSLLEAGCAAGFLVRGLAAMCGTYTGMDIAPQAVKRARSLGIGNAKFRVADARKMPFPEDSFDRVISYNVLINIPDFALAKEMMTEMVRVVRRGGKVMIGSVPDAGLEQENIIKAQDVTRELNEKYGPVKQPDTKSNWLSKITGWYIKNILKIEPSVACYYFHRQNFLDFGSERGLGTEIFDIHPLHPYYGYRFNVVYTK